MLLLAVLTARPLLIAFFLIRLRLFRELLRINLHIRRKAAGSYPIFPCLRCSVPGLACR